MPLALDALLGQISSRHSAEPQKKALALGAAAELQRALNDLMALGFPLAVAEAGPGPEPIEFPKSVYHDELGHDTVNDAAGEAAALAASWRLHPSRSGPPEVPQVEAEPEAPPAPAPSFPFPATIEQFTPGGGNG